MLWIATDGSGIFLLKRDQKSAIPLASAYKSDGQLINSNSVYALFEGEHKRKRIGTLRGGINILEPETAAFTKVVYGEGQRHVSSVENFILSFCEVDKNQIWVGTDGAGLRYWDRADNTFQNYTQNASSVSDDFITGIVKDAQNDIWLSTWFGGVNRFNRQS